VVATDPCPIITSPEKDRKLETHRITKWQILAQSNDHTFFYGWPGKLETCKLWGKHMPYIYAISKHHLYHPGSTFFGGLHSGKHTKSYGKWPFIVELPIKNGDFP
jgi:hypothetical protein